MAIHVQRERGARMTEPLGDRFHVLSRLKYRIVRETRMRNGVKPD